MKTSSAFFRSLLLSAGILAVPAVTVFADEEGIRAKFELLSTGAMEKIGSYMPQRVALSGEKPAGIKKAPNDLTSPLYGEIKLGPAEARGTFYVIVDEPTNKPARLFVDGNGNGDLTDDLAAEWEAETNKFEVASAVGGKDAPKVVKEVIIYKGGASLKVKYGSETAELHIPMYRFDKNDPQRAALASNLFYYADYARSGEIKLGDKTYKALLTDPVASGDFRLAGTNDQPKTMAASRPAALMIDVNDDGKFNAHHESFPINKPFNIGGTTYEITNVTASGGSFTIVKSTNSVPETVPLPALVAGRDALSFTAKTTDGKEVAFPAAYKGKLVILDFWATWCGPCVAELPHLTNAYSEFHPQGLEVLGISLDMKDAETNLAKFTAEHNMPWPQVYDGGFWKAAVATNYFIESIPQAFLVDGDTGKIVAEGGALRGEDLAPTLKKALAKKAQ